jgi:hypothetical protein
MFNPVVEANWNVMAHAQKPDFVFRRNWRVHLNRRGRQFSRLLAAEVCATAVVMLDTPRSEVMWRVLATHSIRQFLLHFPFRASPCVIAFQLNSTSPGLETVGSVVQGVHFITSLTATVLPHRKLASTEQPFRYSCRAEGHDKRDILYKRN